MEDYEIEAWDKEGIVKLALFFSLVKPGSLCELPLNVNEITGRLFVSYNFE